MESRNDVFRLGNLGMMGKRYKNKGFSRHRVFCDDIGDKANLHQKPLGNFGGVLVFFLFFDRLSKYLVL